MHNLSKFNFVSQTLYISEICAAHHQEVYCVYKKLVGFVLKRGLFKIS